MDLVLNQAGCLVCSLEDREKELFKGFHSLPNGPARRKLYKEWLKVRDSIESAFIRCRLCKVKLVQDEVDHYGDTCNSCEGKTDWFDDGDKG